MTNEKYGHLVKELTQSAHEAFDNDSDLGRPQTLEEFSRAMWQDDQHMTNCEASRQEYTDAMYDAYKAWEHEVAADFWEAHLA